MAFKKTGTKNIECKVIEDYGILSTSESGYETKLTYTSWNGREPKYDIRPWKDGKCCKGMTFTGEEIENLYQLLKKIAED